MIDDVIQLIKELTAVFIFLFVTLLTLIAIVLQVLLDGLYTAISYIWEFIDKLESREE